MSDRERERAREKERERALVIDWIFIFNMLNYGLKSVYLILPKIRITVHDEPDKHC